MIKNEFVLNASNMYKWRRIREREINRKRMGEKHCFNAISFDCNSKAWNLSPSLNNTSFVVFHSRREKKNTLKLFVWRTDEVVIHHKNKD